MKQLNMNNNFRPFELQSRLIQLSLILLLTFSAMGQDIKSEYINLSELDMKMHYVVKGQSVDHTIVLVHGLGSYSKAYQKNIDELAKHAKVFAIDLPGFGKTELGQFTPGMKNYASLINEFVTKKKLSHVLLVGHSMGGQIVATLAINEKPKWLDGVSLLSPAGIETFSDTEKAWFANVITDELYLNLTDEQIKQNFNVNFYGAQLPIDAEFMLKDRLLIKQDSVKYKQYSNTIVKCINAMLNEPIYDKISDIDVPIQVFFGDNDLLIPNKILHPNLILADLTKQLKKEHPKVVVNLIEKAGHFIQWDGSDTINRMIINSITNKN
tara:strand:- start:26307 stop:27281 length:975 start_codon:yes stop_codon:yes gene_type:complete